MPYSNRYNLDRYEEPYKGSGMENELVYIANFYHSTDAHILRGLLENEGVRVEIFTEGFNAIYGSVSGGVELWIHPSDAIKARPIIEQYYDNFEREQKRICPECGSDDILRDAMRYLKTIFYLLSYIIVGAPPPKGSPKHLKCNSCNYCW